MVNRSITVVLSHRVQASLLINVAVKPDQTMRGHGLPLYTCGMEGQMDVDDRTDSHNGTD